MNFNFTSSNSLDIADLSDIDLFFDAFPDFQTVTLNDETELRALLELLGIKELIVKELSGGLLSKYWDISHEQLPELTEEEFDEFYQKWLNLSKRENNMDEYGNLIFLQGLSKKWNKQNFRLVVKETT